MSLPLLTSIPGIREATEHLSALQEKIDAVNDAIAALPPAVRISIDVRHGYSVGMPDNRPRLSVVAKLGP